MTPKRWNRRMMVTSSVRKRRKHRRDTIAGLMVVAVIIAGCGSSSSSSSGSSASAGSSAQIVNMCRNMITQAKQPLRFVPPGPPIDVSKLRGKRVMFVSLSQAVPTIAVAASATQQAGKLAGVSVTVFDTKGDVTLMQQAIQQAIAQKYNGIILLGIPLKVTATALKAAHNAGIVIDSELNNEPVASAPGQGAGPSVFGSTGPPRFKSGQLTACKAVVDTNGHANAVIFNTSELEPSAAIVAGMKNILGQCGGCSVSMNDTPTADWQTKLPGLAGDEVRRNPNANYFLPLYDGMGIFVVAGINQAGAAGRVKVASFNAVPAALQEIQNGNVFTADPGQPNSWEAWQGLDQVMRGMLHLKPGNPVMQVRFFDKDNLKGVDVKNEDALFGSAWRAGFMKLWGVK